MASELQTVGPGASPLRGLHAGGPGADSSAKLPFCGGGVLTNALALRRYAGMYA